MVRAFARRALLSCAAVTVVLLALLPALAVSQRADQPRNAIQVRPPRPPTPAGVHISRRRAKVHGPFLPERRRLTIPAPSGSGAGDELEAIAAPEPCPPADCGGLAPLEGSPDDLLSPGLTSGPWYPDAIEGIDPQIAASRALLAIASNNMIGFYDKSGALLKRYRVVGNQLVLDPAFTNPVSAVDFFRVLWADPNANFNQVLNLPPGFCDPAAPFDAGSFCFDAYYDIRVIFDTYRQRFWVGALVKNTENKDWETDPERFTARRDAFAIAVSRTADPRDGWYYYWIAAVGDAWRCNFPDNPENNPALCAGYWPGDGADYESIGISLNHFVMSVDVKNGSNPVLVERGHESRYSAVFALPADALANGVAAPHWVFGVRREGDGGANVQRKIVPARHHGGSSGFSQTWLVSTLGSDRLTMWVLPAWQPVLWGWDVPVTPFVRGQEAEQPAVVGIPTPRRINLGTNVGRLMLNAVVRNDRLHAVWHDCHGMSVCESTIRLVRLCPPWLCPNGVVEVDRSFGTRNILEPASWVSGYGWPSLAVNNANDIVMSYQRAGRNVFYEARYSVYPNSGPDILPSNVLKKGEYTLGTEFIPGTDPCIDVETGSTADCAAGKLDISGSAVDPFDDNAIWMIQKYAVRLKDSEGASRFVVGKVFGTTVADLYVSDLSVGSLADGLVRVDGEIGNGGDGSAAASHIVVSLVRFTPGTPRATSRTVLGELDLGKLAAGEHAKFQLTVKLPPDHAPGTAGARAVGRDARDRIEVMVDPRNAHDEYAEDNNLVQLPLSVR